MMQSLGELLSSARTEKGYSIDQVAHETNISRNYIEFLEQEQFNQFPAEAYLIGFLRNYSEYLGLDAEKNISLYKNHKLSEEPAPIEELVGKKKSKKLPLMWIFLLLALGALGFLGVKLIPLLKAKAESNRQAQEEAQSIRKPQAFQVEKGEQEFLILQGDTLLFSKDELTFEFMIEDKQDHYELTQKDSGTGETHQYSLRLGKEVFLSLFSDTPDFRLILNDYGLSSGEGKLSVFQLESSEQAIEREEEEQDLPTLAEVETAPPSGQGTRKVEPKVILTLASPERFTLDIQFRGYSLYRYELDNRDRNERYYRDGDVFRLDVNRKIQLWLSNAGAAYTKVNGQEVSLGKPGEVAVKSIQWIKNDQGTYDLVLIPVY